MEEEMHQFRLDLYQSYFPFTFITEHLHKINKTDNYLLVLLIFGYPHYLLWESVVTAQLIINQTNNVTFDMKDVCK